MAPQTRLYSIDTLRALAMLLGIVLHGSIAYKAGKQFNLWVIDDEYNSWFYDWLYLFINSFRMQLFFLLAGFFASLSIRKRGAWDFLKNRGRRLALPLAAAFFTILPLTLAPFMYFQYQQADGDATAQLIDFLKRYFTLKERAGLMHLWFIYYLLFYTICFSAAWFIYSKVRSATRDPLAWFKGRSGLFAYGAVLAIVVALIAQGYDTEVPTIWTGLKVMPVQFLYYGAFFAGGIYLEANREIVTRMERAYIPLLITAIVLSFVHVVVINLDPSVMVPEISAAYKCTFALESILFVVGLIGLFNAKFNRPYALSELMSGSAYWVYLVHLPLVLYFQLTMIDSLVPGVLRFWVVISVTFAVAISSYLVFVRGKWLGKFLDGK